MKKILFFLFSAMCFSQTQIGNNIYGTGTAYSASGTSVSLSSDGTIVAVGTPGDYPSNSGKVRVFKNISGVWTQIGTEITGSNFDSLGASVSLSTDGTVLAIGAPRVYYAGAVNNYGYVKVFKNINNVWIQIGLTINSEDDNSYFGSSLDLSSDGSVIAIGARFYSGSASNIGKVKVFKNINNTWTQIGNNFFGGIQNDQLGMSLSLSSNGTKLAIGGYNTEYSIYKFVRLFENINGVWTQIGNDISFGGYSIDLSADGTTLIVGDPNFSSGFGKVRVYNTTNGNFTQIGPDFDSAHVWDQFGDSVKLSSDGSYLGIGSSWYGPNTSRFGKVSIYRNDNQNWIERSNIIGSAYDDLCGQSISLSSDGSIVAAGSPGSLGFYNQTSSGVVKIYDTAPNLSSDSFVLDNFSIHPNPTTTILNINFKGDLIFKKATIYSTLGQLIKTSTTETINVSELSNGTYFIEVLTDKGKATKSFIKE